MGNPNLNKYCLSCGKYFFEHCNYCIDCGRVLIYTDLPKQNYQRKKNQNQKNEYPKDYPYSKNEMFQQNLDLGQEFQIYVEKTIFPSPFYEIVYRTSHSSYPKTLADRIWPDLVFKANFIEENPYFGIECKYHKTLYPKVYTLKKNEVEKFREFNKVENIPVFIIMGADRIPSNPESLFSIPFKDSNFSDDFSLENHLYMQKDYLISRFSVKCDYPLFYDKNCLSSLK